MSSEHIDPSTAARLRSFVERIERVNEEIKALNEDKKEIFSEAKGDGFDTKIIKKIVAIRAKDPEEIDEEEALLDVYKRALGMIPDFDEDSAAPLREAAE